MKLKQTIEPENQFIVDLIKVGSPIGKIIRTDQEANVRSPIRPYGDGSFLSLRDHFFADAPATNNPYNFHDIPTMSDPRGGTGMHNRGHSDPTEQTDMVWNRQEDEEITG
jgi:hypothetical protein